MTVIVLLCRCVVMIRFIEHGAHWVWFWFGVCDGMTTEWHFCDICFWNWTWMWADRLLIRQANDYVYDWLKLCMVNNWIGRSLIIGRDSGNEWVDPAVRGGSSFGVCLVPVIITSHDFILNVLPIIIFEKTLLYYISSTARLTPFETNTLMHYN